MTSLALACKLNAARTPTSLAARAVAAIRRNNGSLLLPGAATPVLGPELVTNGDGNSAAGWTTYGCTASVSGGMLVLTAIAGVAYPSLTSPTITTTIGKEYLVTVTGYTGTSGNPPGFNSSPQLTPQVNTSLVSGATSSYVLKATAASTSVFVFVTAASSTAGTTLFDNVSVKEILSYTHGNPPIRNYLDSAGTDILDSVTQVDQPVGLCLDSMGQVGPNVFSDATSCTFAGESVRVSPGVYRVFSSAGVYSAVSVSGGLQQNKTYRLRFYQDGAGTGRLAVDGPVGALVPEVASGVGWKECIATMTTVVSLTIKRSSGVTDIQISNVAIEEIPGNHASQPTTASKPILRRGLVNQLTQSDFQNGVTDVPGRAGFVTASTLTGYGGALALGHDGSTNNVAYKLSTLSANTSYTIAAVFEMTDGGAPSFANSAATHSTNDFAFVLAQNPLVPTTYSVTALGGGRFMVSAQHTTGTPLNSNVGVIKYATNSNRTFKVTRYGLFTGAVTADQILAAGGIPLTTTAAASFALGRYWWQFDGSNDSLTTGITTGNEGWICAGVTPANTTTAMTIVNAGATSDASKGVWLYSNAGSWVFRVGNGAARADPGALVATSGVPAVISGGWTASTVTLDKDGASVSAARSGDCTSPTTAIVGTITGGTIPFAGSMSATVYCPTLPSAADRALIRRFVGSLQGQSL